MEKISQSSTPTRRGTDKFNASPEMGPVIGCLISSVQLLTHIHSSNTNGFTEIVMYE